MVSFIFNRLVCRCHGVLSKKPIAKILESEIKMSFVVGVDDADDVELGPGIIMVKQSKLDERFVLEGQA